MRGAKILRWKGLWLGLGYNFEYVELCLGLHIVPTKGGEVAFKLDLLFFGIYFGYEC